MHLIYLIHEFHNLSWIIEINELFHDILIYWDAPVSKVKCNEKWKYYIILQNGMFQHQILRSYFQINKHNKMDILIDFINNI